MKGKHEGKQVNIFSGGSVCRYPSRWVARSLCRLSRKRRNKMKRYTDEQVHLWTYKTVETWTGRSQRLIGMKVWKWTRRVMKGYIYYLLLYYHYWSLLYSAILRSGADSLRSHVILHEWIAFYSAFLNIHRSGVFTVLAWLVPQESAAISARSVYTIQPCTVSLHAKPHTSGAYVFGCNLPPALLAEWPGSFTCYCGNTGVERIPK